MAASRRSSASGEKNDAIAASAITDWGCGRDGRGTRAHRPWHGPSPCHKHNEDKVLHVVSTLHRGAIMCGKWQET